MKLDVHLSLQCIPLCHYTEVTCQFFLSWPETIYIKCSETLLWLILWTKYIFEIKSKCGRSVLTCNNAVFEIFAKDLSDVPVFCSHVSSRPSFGDRGPPVHGHSVLPITFLELIFGCSRSARPNPFSFLFRFSKNSFKQFLGVNGQTPFMLVIKTTCIKI